MRSANSSVESTLFGSTTRRLPCAHMGSIGLSQGLLTGRRQATLRSTHPLAIALHLAIVFPYPGAHRFTNVPRCIVPYQSQDTFVHRFQPLTTPFKKLNRDIADRTSIQETQPDFLVGLSVFLRPPQQYAVTSQGFGVRVVFSLCLFNQAQWLIRVGPRRQVGLGKTAPPHFIAETLYPIWIRLAQANQPVPCVFFRSYPGSGLVIQCLARFHFTPRRSSVWRMVSSLTRWAVRPFSKLTSAASSKVHRLLGLSNSLGLRCSRPRSASAPSLSKAGWVLWGRREPCFRASTPRSLKARIASRTVWSLQPRNWAIAGAISPRALANMIWQRRTAKASDERRPAFNCLCSSGVSSRTKIGVLIPGSISLSQVSCLGLR